MNSEITLENLAARVAELERKLAERDPANKPDWRSTIGFFESHQGLQDIFKEGQAIREKEREEARREENPE